MFETSRLPSSTTSYHLNWPGKIVHSETVIALGSPSIDSITEQGDYTQLTVKGHNEEPPPPGLQPQQPAAFDRDQFSFVWVNGKETMSFTDRRLRLKLRTEIPLFDQIRNLPQANLP